MKKITPKRVSDSKPDHQAHWVGNFASVLSCGLKHKSQNQGLPQAHCMCT